MVSVPVDNIPHHHKLGLRVQTAHQTGTYRRLMGSSKVRRGNNRVEVEGAAGVLQGQDEGGGVPRPIEGARSTPGQVLRAVNGPNPTQGCKEKQEGRWWWYPCEE